MQTTLRELVSNMKYAVTGGTGFLGEHLVKRLLNEGHEVNSIVRAGNTTAHRELLEASEKLSVFEYDGTRDSLISAIEDVDYVIHLAALFTTRKDEASVKTLMKSNIDYSVNLLSAIDEFNSNTGFASASTFSAFDETGSYKPQSFYAATKHAVEILAAGFNIKATFLRFSDTYGTNDPRTKIMNLVRDAVKEKREFSFQSPADQKINLTHYDDVVDALIEAAKQSKDRSESGVKAYDLFYPENEVTLGEMADILNAKTNTLLNFPIVGKITELPPQIEILPNFTPKRTPQKDLAKTVLGE